MKKKKRLTAIATGLFAMLLMVGCSKAEEIIEEKPAEPKQAEKSEEKATEKETIRGQINDLTIKKEPYVGTKKILKSTIAASAYMQDGHDHVTDVNLEEELFSVFGVKGNASYRPRLNKDSYITFYSKVNDTTGNGSYLDVTIKGDRQISNIVVNYNSNAQYAAVFNSTGVEKAAFNVEGNAYSYAIDGSSFRVQNHFNISNDTNPQVQVNSIDIYYDGDASIAAASGETNSALSYSYIKTVDKYTDTLNSAFTGITGSTYTEWSDKNNDSNITYKGFSAGGNDSIRLKDSGNSGIVVTENDNNHVAKKVTIKWNENTPAGDTQIMLIYGKNTAYTATSDLYNSSTRGTQFGTTLSFDDRDGDGKTSLTLDVDYKYLGIRLKSSSKVSYIESINIEWEAIPVYTYSNVAIRFGGLIKKPLWDRLENIQGYGVMVAADEDVDDALKNHYNPAKVNEDCAGEDIKNYYTPLTLEKTNPAEANADQKPADGRVYYIWNLYQRISNLSLTKSVTSVAYIKLESEVVFLQEVTTNVSDLADELIASGEYTAEDFDGSLKNLADLA